MVKGKLWFIVGSVVFAMALVASCTVPAEPDQTTAPEEAGQPEIPYYFIAIHNEPYHYPGGEQLIERDYLVLKQMIEKADSYNISLTLMFTAQWADYISESPERLADLESWQKQGHEIAAHHHSIYHGNWDGYTDYSEEEAIEQRMLQGHQPEVYLGTLEDYITKLKELNPEIKSGCLNDELDKRALPDEIIYDTCSGFANFGEPGRRLSDTVAEKGKNEYVTVGIYKDIQRKWLAHYQITTPERQQQAQLVFNSMCSGVYGVVTHSISIQAESYYAFLEFLHTKDPTGELSRTVTEIIEQGLLPERQIPDELLLSGLMPSGSDESTDNIVESQKSLESPFGIFGAYALEYSSFQNRMGFDANAYWDWVDEHFQALGAHWTRSNLQLIWDFIEPEIGQGYRWQNEFHTDPIITRISESPASVHWVGVFHEGGASNDPSKSSLRDPMDYPEEYSQFVKAAVERYDGDGTDDLDPAVRVKYWQVGNEYPFWEKKGRTLDEYLAWARLTAVAIKEADPEARVVLIAETQGFTVELWLRGAIEELAPTHYMDVIDIHHWGTASNWRMNSVPEVRSLLNSLGRPDAEIFSCEHGTWAGNPDGQPAQSEEEQACSLVKRFVYNLNNGLDKLFWNNLMEWDAFGGQAGSIFNSMGLISDGSNSGDSPDRFNTTRIAYWSYWLLAHYLGNDIRLGEKIDVGVDGVFLYRFPATSTAGVRFVGWSEAGEVSVTIEEPGFTGVTITLVPDRYGDIGTTSLLSADALGNVLIRLGLNPTLFTECVK